MLDSTPIHEAVKDTCRRHHVSRSHLYNLIGLGKVTAKKNGKRTLIVVASADAYFNNLPVAEIKPSPQAKRRAMAASTAA